MESTLDNVEEGLKEKKEKLLKEINKVGFLNDCNFFKAINTNYLKVDQLKEIYKYFLGYHYPS